MVYTLSVLIFPALFNINNNFGEQASEEKLHTVTAASGNNGGGEGPDGEWEEGGDWAKDTRTEDRTELDFWIPRRRTEPSSNSVLQDGGRS